jgi:hypothetical protein
MLAGLGRVPGLAQQREEVVQFEDGVLAAGGADAAALDHEHAVAGARVFALQGGGGEPFAEGVGAVVLGLHDDDRARRGSTSSGSMMCRSP